MPDSFKSGGWISIGFIFLSGLASWYTGTLIIECLYYRPGSRLQDYPSIGEAAFGIAGRRVLMTFHYAIMLGVATLFIMLSGQNLQSFSSNRGFEINERIWIAIAGSCVLIPYATTKSMKEVAGMSVIGVATTVITVIISCTVGLLDFKNQGVINRELINWAGIPTSLATIGFSFGGTVIYTHVEASMRHPKMWPYVLAMALGSVSILYLLMGSTGYLVYGDKVLNPILNSLPSSIAVDIAFIIITLHLVATAPLPLTSFSLEFERLLKIEDAVLVRVCTRVLIVTMLTLIAAFLPYFGKFMALVGALSNLVLVYFAPVLCHLKLFGWRNRSLHTYLLMTACLLMGLFGGAWGAVDAVRGIIRLASKDFGK
ncbi:hypothetical protein DSO57_1036677 [Entomophthora muscae]|uniref:Uncharacterized protein n=1 Tax=Entomophthora muscae TaxID=34485 RepID=A0ACC2UJ80_9FUNG|nr:hypothetical protein DSO57_1036677 [Entomophthora muscae]